VNEAQRQALDGCIRVRDDAAEFIRQVEINGIRLNRSDGSDGTDAMLQTARDTVDRMNRVIDIWRGVFADDQVSK
jgi:hypothetical protein